MTNFTAKRGISFIGSGEGIIENLDHLKVEIDLPAYTEIKRLQGIVQQASEFAALTVGSPGWYETCDEEGNESDYREDGADMTVLGNIVFFGGNEKHSDIRWECDAISIADLDTHFAKADAA